MKYIFSMPRMARLRWLLLALLFPILAPTPAAAWWQTDWSYRKQITIDTTPKGANIADPAGREAVLVRLHSGNFAFGDAQDTGADLRFIGSDDKTPLTFHIESFDPLLGVATIWVDVPDFPAGAPCPARGSRRRGRPAGPCGGRRRGTCRRGRWAT